jgi:hypothetical protein
MVSAALAAALSAGLWASSAAAAQPVAVRYGEDFLALAYAPGRVLVAEAEPFGARAIVVRELRLSDGDERVVLAIPYAEDDPPDLSLAANATGYLIALRGDSGREHIVLGGYDGSQRTVVDCAPPSLEGVAPGAPVRLNVVAGTTGFAFAGATCGPAAMAAVGADGTLTPVGGDGPTDYNASLAYTEPHFAVALRDTVRIVDVTTGAERRLPPGNGGGAAPIAVLADGTLVVDGPGPTKGLYAWPQGAAMPRFLSDRGSFSVVRAASDRVVFQTLSGPRVVSSAGGFSRRVIAPGAGLPTLLGLDGTRVALQSFSCAGERQVAVIDLDEPRPAGQVTGCPVRLSGGGAVRFGPSGRAHIRVRCANGCRTRMDLFESSTSRDPCDALDERRCRIYATARLNLSPSRRSHRVTLRLTRSGRARRHRTVDVRTSLGGNFALSLSREIREATL